MPDPYYPHCRGNALPWSLSLDGDIPANAPASGSCLTIEALARCAVRGAW